MVRSILIGRPLCALPFLFLILCFQNAGWGQTPPKNSCVECHLDLWGEMKGSVHSQQGIFCNSCHGGDPARSDKDQAKAPGTGYVGVPDKKTSVETCGNCHADVERMNFYGIRTDQLARYKTSGHGKKLLQAGDAKVAACIDCHGYHDVVPVSDPNSPIYPINLPKTCHHCHGNEALMKNYGLPTDIFETYRKSVHGQALLEKKDLSVAYCTSCHGSHGAIPPGVKSIGESCGKCHMNEKKFFLESPHAAPMKEGKFSECIVCHGNHGIERPDKRLYQETCVKCHAPASGAVKLGEKLAGVLGKSEDKLRATEALVKQASIEGIFVEEEIGALEEAKTNVIAMAPLQHTLSLERISELSQKFVEAAENIEAKVHRKRQFLKWRKIALIPLWIFFLAMVTALWAKYKRLKHGRPGEDEKERHG